MEALKVKDKFSNKSRRFESVFVWVAPAALLLSLLAAPRSAQAQLPPTDDTYVKAGTTTHNGSDPNLRVIQDTQSTISLIRFDLGSLPSGIAGSAVANATLTLFVTQLNTAGSFNVLQVTSSWTESTVTGATAPTLGSVIASGVVVGSSSSGLNDFVEINVTSALQSWLNGTPNYGIALVPIGTPVNVYFASKENTAPSHEAVLLVSLNGPAGPQGPIGLTGATGTTGPQGPAGAAGATGPAGPAGPQGPIGLTGATGAQGATGTAGPAGPAGAQGPAGVQGPAGPQGATGPAGGPTNVAAIALLRWYTGSVTYSAGTGPWGLAFDGANIWVTNNGGNTLTKILASTGATVGTYAPAGLDGPYGIAFDGTNIWVANNLSGNVIELLASTGATVGTYPVGSLPFGIAFDGTNIWVANSGSGNVTKLLASTGATVGNYPVGSGPTGIAFDGTNIWVANHDDGTVTKLSPSGTILGTFAVGPSPFGVAFDGTNIWVANGSSGGSVTKLLASTGAVLGTYPAGGGLGVAFDGTNIWASNYGSGSVTELLASTGAILGTHPTGAGAWGVAFDGANIWVANNGGDTGNTVTEILPAAQ
jgi:hypothetical protein